MAQIKETAVVYSQEMLAPDIYSMWIATKAAADAKPGQFISVYTKDGSRLLPRPISICEIDKEEGRLRIVYRIAGAGTEEFSHYQSGDPSRSWDRWEMASLRRGRRCSSSEEESESRRC